MLTTVNDCLQLK